ncbi:unnamed protein product [Oppiella nova]|uniref:Uncharacterized protein n=1 Tax=Oppiella nova TaxID=334625 RepID=A0A7R9QDT8_9ACAR|nr:unnamed protein product [Oppiella nova]CAG2163790.1 unnamed protein product [Oppiella nova]
MVAAGSAGFVSCTATNPIWFVKTRLQLDQSKYGAKTAWNCIKDIYRQSGVIGFYKGITASYFGISETIIHFVIYEFIKTKLTEIQVRRPHQSERTTGLYFVQYMAAGAVSKSFASILAYPHEVARTRLREEGNKYRSFIQTLYLVWREEGVKNEVARTRLREEGNKYRSFIQTLYLVWREEGVKNGLYRGLATQLILVLTVRIEEVLLAVPDEVVDVSLESDGIRVTFLKGIPKKANVAQGLRIQQLDNSPKSP